MEDEYYGNCLPHTWNEQNVCEVCETKKPYEERDGRIYFGEYPQTKVTDDGIISTLSGMSGDRPVKGNRGNWTDYEYYIHGEVDEYMWYIDLKYQESRYRGVYFISYRGGITSGGDAIDSNQDDNGYYINTLYWFIWEPIEWKHLSTFDNEGEAFLMSNMILDNQQFYNSFGDRVDEIYGTAIYSNNYKESDIRAWLNDNFYNSAFDSDDKTIIKTSTVNNGANTTKDNSNIFACENTEDNIFLLSYSETLRLNVETRRLKPTDYALSQNNSGALRTQYDGNGAWLLRSPETNARYVLYVNDYGYAGDWTYATEIGAGTVPALRITL